MFLEPFTIVINQQQVQLGQPLPPSIQHFAITISMPMQIPSDQAVHLKGWLNAIIDRLDTDYVTYNGVLIPASELTKF